MAIELILQGLTKRTHADVLSEMFAGDVERAIISVAFVSSDGVDHIEPLLAAYADQITVYAGIRNEITSAQALKRLLEVGVSLYAVDTGSRSLLFHPKLYHVRAEETAQLSVGSANLTLGGLNNNIEAGVLIELSLDDDDDLAFVDDLEASFDGLAAEHPENVFEVEDEAAIDELLNAGRLIDETAAPPPRSATKAKTSSADATPRMRMAISPVRRSPRAVKKPSIRASRKTTTQPIIPTKGIAYELVWVSKELKERDLNIPTGSNTARTGSINLDKGMMEADVDHRHYFREEVFPALAWPSQSEQVDTATASFAVVIKGVDHGTHTLTVRHTTSTTSTSYKQKNAMTRISWGTLAPAVRDRNLLKRRMSLYRDKADATRFLIEID